MRNHEVNIQGFLVRNRELLIFWRFLQKKKKQYYLNCFFCTLDTHFYVTIICQLCTFLIPFRRAIRITLRVIFNSELYIHKVSLLQNETT